MAKTVLNVKMDVQVKKAAQKLAKEIGVPLSTIINAQTKRFIYERRVELEVPLVPSAYLKKVIAKAESDRAKGADEYSPAFTSAEDAVAWLKR